MAATPIPTLLAETTCYACVAPGDIPALGLLGLLSRLASGGGGCVVPDAPLMDLPTFASPGNYTLNWSAPTGAVSYLVDLAEDAGFTIQILTDEPSPVNSLVVADVTGAERYARVRAVNACGQSEESNVINFNSSGLPLLARDNFESYVAGDDLGGLNGGVNWDSAYVSRTSLYVVSDDFESYSAAAALSGLNGGSNWDAAYVSRP